MLPLRYIMGVYDCHLCEVNVEVVKKSVLLFQEFSVSGTQTKPLMTELFLLTQPVKACKI